MRNNQKSIFSAILFIIFFFGMIFLLLGSGLVLTRLGGKDAYKYILGWLLLLIITIVSAKVSASLVRSLNKKPTKKDSNNLSFDLPWLILDDHAVQYKKIIFNAESGIEFYKDNTGKSRYFNFADIKIKHSYLLRLPVLYMIYQDRTKYTIAFVVDASDVQNIKKNIGAIIALGEAGALINSRSAIKSSYSQAMIHGDVIEQIYRWFKKYQRNVYVNKVSRNVLMLIVFVAFIPTFVTIMIIIEQLTN